MKKMLLIFLTSLLVVTGAAAASFSIDEQENINLAGVDKIIFNLNTPSCALCISTGNQTYGFTGGGRSGKLSLSLEGDLKSNNKKAVPSLIVNETGSIVTIQLFKDRNLFFGLIQSGSTHFSAELPEYFDGDIEIRTASGDSTVADLKLKSFILDSSSGDNDVRDIEALDIRLKASSGDINAMSLNAVKGFEVKSSSGDLELDDILSQTADIHASSGRINIGKVRSTRDLIIDSRSGRIVAEYLESSSMDIKASSGKVSVDEILTQDLQVVSSSGDITIKKLNAESTDLKASSGETTIGVALFDGDISIISSSGDVSINLPAGSAFDAELEASSGRIRSDFTILGDVSEIDEEHITGKANGGGYNLKVKASSGDITIKQE